MEQLKKDEALQVKGGNRVNGDDVNYALCNSSYNSGCTTNKCTVKKTTIG
jgi:hypothetical protein